MMLGINGSFATFIHCSSRQQTITLYWFIVQRCSKLVLEKKGTFFHSQTVCPWIVACCFISRVCIILWGFYLHPFYSTSSALYCLCDVCQFKFSANLSARPVWVRLKIKVFHFNLKLSQQQNCYFEEKKTTIFFSCCWNVSGWLIFQHIGFPWFKFYQLLATIKHIFTHSQF